MIWVIATLIAAIAQTGRNAAQAGLSSRIGTIGSTSVRFIFGLPFAALLLLSCAAFTPIPAINWSVAAYTAMGALAQITATALMLLTMRGRSFGVATALTKTEPVSLALLGVFALGETLDPARLAAITLTTFGVLLTSGAGWTRAAAMPVLTGVAAGALFGLSAIGFRAALLDMPEAGFAIRALTVLTLNLTIQTVLMLGWMVLADRRALRGIAGEIRVSLAAGALGAFASLFWFIGFALTSAANVRTLALFEVVFAQILSGRVFREDTPGVQLAGIGLIILGVGWLLALAVG